MAESKGTAPRKPQPHEQHYFVLFADLLGFKNIVLNQKLPKKEHLDFRDPPAFGRFKGGTIADLLGIATSNPLSQAFIAFHGGIELTYRDTHWNEQASLLVFSDSVFLASPALEDCFGFAERLMLYCLGQEAPLRMGIGHGSFLAFGFAFEDSPRLKYMSSQFLGSGVIHATETEKRVQGLRIGVHDSAAAIVREKDFAVYKLLVLPEEERLPGLQYEWNYFGEWSENFYEPKYPTFNATQFRAIVAHVSKMQDAAPKDDEKVQRKYSNTQEAITRMGKAVATAEEDPRFKAPTAFELPPDWNK